MRWFSWFTGVWMVGYFLSAIFMGAWALYDTVTEPTDEQIYYVLATDLKRKDAFLGREPLTDLDLRHEGNRRYEGTAKSQDGTIFVVKAELRSDRLEYAAKSDNAGRQGSRGCPGFLERHSWSWPWLYISVFSLAVFGAVFALAGLVGLRPRLRLPLEILLYACAVINLIFAVYEGSWLVELFA